VCVCAYVCAYVCMCVSVCVVEGGWEVGESSAECRLVKRHFKGHALSNSQGNKLINS